MENSEARCSKTVASADTAVYFDSVMKVQPCVVRLLGKAGDCDSLVERYCVQNHVPLFRFSFAYLARGKDVFDQVILDFAQVIDTQMKMHPSLGQAFRPIAQEGIPDDPFVPQIVFACMVRWLELAAHTSGVRPVCHWANAEKLMVQGEHGVSLAWSLRNEVQCHSACRHVISGEQPEYRLLEGLNNSPLLNMGYRIYLAESGVAPV